MAKLTSAAANKLIRSLEDRKEYLLQEEDNNRSYILAQGEKDEIPEYEFAKTDREITEIDARVRRIKHAVNVFNSTTVLSTGGTIDESLVEMAQLNRKLERLDPMRKAKPKERLSMSRASRANATEFQYLNYDPQEVQQAYAEALSRIQAIQLALDKANQVLELEIG